MNGLIAFSGPDGYRLVSAVALALGYVGFVRLVFRSHARRSARAEAAARSRIASQAADRSLLIAFASQTGAAERLARLTAETMVGGRFDAVVADLEHVDAPLMAAARHVLFVVSTTGDGDPPDGAVRFARAMLSAPADLAGLHYGILALGDRRYPRYCAFGHRLDAWLRHSGAEALFDLVEVDDGDAGALRQWQHNLRDLTGRSDSADWEPPAYDRWRLAERRLVNAGSPGGPVYHLVLTPVTGPAWWKAGDIAEIGPEHHPADVADFLEAVGLDGTPPVRLDGRARPLAEALATRALPDGATERAALALLEPQQIVDRLVRLPDREYSIASIAASGRLELLVRQARRPDGRLGLGSGWLTADAPLGTELALRVRENRAFRAPDPRVPLLLVGNGTGLAGLRAHVAERAASGGGPVWLCFGERTAAHDRFFRDDLDRWVGAGVLARVDVAFSRDADDGRYVQDLLLAAADDVRRWVSDGAAIYVCGSFHGMAAGVHAALTTVLGDDAVTRLADDGRYRRDVY
jgi:sulfite reductase (NADPH) flavoprotein alpha-component